MAKKRNIIVGQSGGRTSVINSSLAGVYKMPLSAGSTKVYGMLHGGAGTFGGGIWDLSTQIHSELDIELLKRTPSAFWVPAVISCPKSMRIKPFMRNCSGS